MNVQTAINSISSSSSGVAAENLLTNIGIGLSSNKQIDRIRMRGVKNIAESKHYIHISYWTTCITSKLALHHLSVYDAP